MNWVSQRFVGDSMLWTAMLGSERYTIVRSPLPAHKGFPFSIIGVVQHEFRTLEEAQEFVVQRAAEKELNR